MPFAKAPTGRSVLALYLSSILLLAALLGAIIHGALTTASTTNLTNQFLPMWHALFLAISAVNIVTINYSPPQSLVNRILFFGDLTYLGVITIGYFICWVAWGVARQWDAFAWCTIDVLAGASAVAFLVLRSIEARKRVSDGTASDESKGNANYGSTENGHMKRCLGCLGCLNWTLKVLHLVVVALLCNGSITQALARRFPAPGTRVQITMTDSRITNLHYLCTGPVNSPVPTIWIIADHAHGVVDFYGLQHYLSSNRTAFRRVCTYDNPGFGWSDDYLPDTMDSLLYLDALIVASGERVPIVLVAWGGGGTMVTSYASAHPEKVVGIAFVEVYEPGIEFNIVKVKNNWTNAQTDNYRITGMNGRAFMANIILGLAIPWGLISIFVPASPVDPGYWPEDKWTEFRAQSWTSKMWIPQYWGIRYMATNPPASDPLFTLLPFPPHSPTRNITFSAIYCSKPDNLVCSDPSDANCASMRFDNKLYIQSKKDVAKRAVGPGGVVNVVENYDADCALSMPVHLPEWTARAVLDTLGGVQR
ncbi:hypothetical protein BJ742DRAFT_781370 [Cladochytrium replicatum]|nr:hypothetical protein BJ742DRAFT_781370 [Cladochytrium replicatum]